MSFADKVDLLLNRQRDALLHIARSYREERDALLRPRNPDPIPAGVKYSWVPRSAMPSPDPETDPFGVEQDLLAVFYTGQIAKLIEGLVPLMDAIRDRRRRLKTMKTIDILMGLTFSYALNCQESPVEQRRADHRMWRARSTNAHRVEQRRERLRPLVAEMVRKFPSEGPAKIATRLRKRKDFEAQFRASRRTLEADVDALLTPSETE